MKARLALYLLTMLPLGCLLVSCENEEAPDQLTVVEGAVQRRSDQAALAGVPLVIRPYSLSFYGASYKAPVASTQTDANGHYRLSFYNTKGLYYGVFCDPDYTDRRLDFLPPPATAPALPTIEGDLRSRRLEIGRKNTVDFLPDQRMIVLLRLQVRSTRFQQLLISGLRPLKINSLDTVVVRNGYYSSGLSESATLRRVGVGGQTERDSTVYLYSLSNITSDTVRTTFRLVQ